MSEHNTHHADLSNFSSEVTKQEAYDQVLASAEALFEGQRNWVCNLSNSASLLWHALKSISPEDSPSRKVNWSGFYVQDPSQQNQLILGPFHGKVACQTIRIGSGVCGTAASSKQTQLVENVEEFPGHIACDGETKSEIVVPILDQTTGVVRGVIDIDCEELNGFDQVDKSYLEKFAVLLSESCDW